MAFTVADLTTLKKIVLAVLNASSAFASTSDDDKFTDGEIAEYIFEGDERYYTAGAETKGGWMRPDVMDWGADITTYLAEVTAHLGELGDVKIKYASTDSGYQLGKRAKREEIEIIRNDTDSIFSAAHSASGTLSAGLYDPEALKDGVCAFTGYAMSIRVVASYLRTAALQSPSNWTSAIAAHALSLGFSKDGLDPQLAGYYATQADKYELRVRANAKDLTELAELRKAA